MSRRTDEDDPFEKHGLGGIDDYSRELLETEAHKSPRRTKRQREDEEARRLTESIGGGSLRGDDSNET